MKKLILFSLFISFLGGCKKTNIIINSPGIPSGLTFFSLSDKDKRAFLGKEQVILNVTTERVQTYKEAKYPLLMNEIGGIDTTATGKAVFRLFSNNVITEQRFQDGDNKWELLYPNGTKDLIEINLSIRPSSDGNSAVIVYNKVIYNGKEILKENSSVPVKGSFIFNLQ